MSRLNIEKCKKLIQFKKPVSLFTRHRDGDRYNGIIVGCSKDVILIESDNDFVFDGIIALPTRQIKNLRHSQFEKTLDRIFTKFGLLKLKKRSPWLLKTETMQQLVSECFKRKLWPIIEMQHKRGNALYIGPITSVEKNGFQIFAYDANGKWEKNYSLTYNEIFKIQLFDKYSTYFNKFMKEKVETKTLLKKLFERKKRK